MHFYFFYFFTFTYEKNEEQEQEKENKNSKNEELVVIALCVALQYCRTGERQKWGSRKWGRDSCCGVLAQTWVGTAPVRSQFVMNKDCMVGRLEDDLELKFFHVLAVTSSQQSETFRVGNRNKEALL